MKKLCGACLSMALLSGLCVVPGAEEDRDREVSDLRAKEKEKLEATTKAIEADQIEVADRLLMQARSARAEVDRAQKRWASAVLAEMKGAEDRRREEIGKMVAERVAAFAAEAEKALAEKDMTKAVSALRSLRIWHWQVSNYEGRKQAEPLLDRLKKEEKKDRLRPQIAALQTLLAAAAAAKQVIEPEVTVLCIMERLQTEVGDEEAAKATKQKADGLWVTREAVRDAAVYEALADRALEVKAHGQARAFLRKRIEGLEKLGEKDAARKAQEKLDGIPAGDAEEGEANRIAQCRAIAEKAVALKHPLVGELLLMELIAVDREGAAKAREQLEKFRKDVLVEQIAELKALIEMAVALKAWMAARQFLSQASMLQEKAADQEGLQASRAAKEKLLQNEGLQRIDEQASWRTEAIEKALEAGNVEGGDYLLQELMGWQEDAGDRAGLEKSKGLQARLREKQRAIVARLRQAVDRAMELRAGKAARDILKEMKSRQEEALDNEGWKETLALIERADRIETEWDREFAKRMVGLHSLTLALARKEGDPESVAAQLERLADAQRRLGDDEGMARTQKELAEARQVLANPTDELKAKRLARNRARLSGVKVAFEMQERLLADAVDPLRIVAGIPIIFDPQLAEAGADQELKVTVSFPSSALDEALNRVCGAVGAKWDLNHAGVIISLPPDVLEKVKAKRATEAKPEFPLWDGKEALAAYANRVGLPAEMSLDLGNGVMMEFVLVPAGRFRMGSPATEEGRSEQPGEEDQHSVTITRAFYTGKYEVTQEQYAAITGLNSSRFKGAKNPVDNVTWKEAQEFCRSAGAKTRRIVRVPTEAEWEYACRAGSTTRFCTGNQVEDLAKTGWYSGNSSIGTHPVGQKVPNAWGLYDMHGNVMELCQDWCGEYEARSAVDPTGPETGKSRVLRGGAWNGYPVSARSARRSWCSESVSSFLIGFRCVVNAK